MARGIIKVGHSVNERGESTFKVVYWLDVPPNLVTRPLQAAKSVVPSITPIEQAELDAGRVREIGPVDLENFSADLDRTAIEQQIVERFEREQDDLRAKEPRGGREIGRSYDKAAKTWS